MPYLETVQELLEAKEGEHVQFKEAKKQFDSREAAKCCCALANNGGGKLVFGITDKRPRSVVGSAAFDQPERTRMGLIEKLKVNVDFQLFNYEGKRVLVFVARQFFCETRTEFLRKNSPVLRSKSETRSLASTAPKMEGAAHVKGRVLAWGGAAFAAPPLAFCPWGSNYPSVASPASSAASWAATGSVYSDQP